MVMALESNALTLEDVIGWADGKISAEREFDARLIDVSLAASVGEAITALNALEPMFDKPKVAALVFRFFHEALASGKGDHRKIAKALYEMAMGDYVPAPELKGPMWIFWDGLDLAVDGIYGDPDAIKAEILAFLADAVA